MKRSFRGPLLLLCLICPVHAQQAENVTRPSAYYPAGDPERGESLAVQCAACHIEAAPPVGDPPVHAPRLRHQRASAIFYALLDYRAKRRRSTVMEPIARLLSEQDMRDLAVYLAGPRLTTLPKPVRTAAHDRAASICGFCHGETGLGVMDGYPVLAGQHVDYLDKALADYRSGARTNPTMAVIAQEITPEQAHELAQYFAQYADLESIP
jgi:cytochrome c553